MFTSRSPREGECYCPSESIFAARAPSLPEIVSARPTTSAPGSTERAIGVALGLGES